VADLPQSYRVVYSVGLDFSPDGTRLAVWSDHEKINVWDWRNNRIEQTIEKPQGATSEGVTDPLRYSVDGHFLIACHSRVKGLSLRIWSTANWSIARDIEDPGAGGCNAMGLTADGKLLIRAVNRSGTPGDNVIAYTVGTWQKVWGLRIERFGPISVAISPDSRLLAVAGTLHVTPTGVQDPIQRMQQSRFEPVIHLIDPNEAKVLGTIKSQAIGSIAWSPDGTRLAIVGGLRVEILDAVSGQDFLSEKLEDSGSMNARYTPDGKYFIESDLNGMGRGLGVKIWDSQRHKLLQHIPGDIGSIAISRDSKYLAVGATGHTTVWQIK
jgi:WD40 repeat protein